MEWKISDSLVDYEQAVAEMEQRTHDIQTGNQGELIWLLEHPPLYTSGTSAKPSDLLSAPFPVYAAGRGGQYTYHGPGQRIAYVMLDLKKRNLMDLRKFVTQLEQWVINTLAQFGVESFIREGRVGVWVSSPSPLEGEGRGGGYGSKPLYTPPPNLPPQGGEEFKEAKIAALGIRVRKWVTFHGISINVNPNLSHYAGIVPCGIKEYGVTSLEKLGIKTDMKSFDDILKKKFNQLFLDL